ncbi:hypothetical protein ACHQM5_001265 [Ranunculus cassubicifolius]
MSAERKSAGTVKWFNNGKGFGLFITPDDGGEDLFVHQSSIKSEGFRSLAEGEAIEFSIETGGDGKTKVVDVSGPNGAYVKGAPKRDDFGGGDYGHLARDCSSQSSGSGGCGGGGACSWCINKFPYLWIITLSILYTILMDICLARQYI